jgi:hypothetical protein
VVTKKCGAEGVTSAHILCKCEDLGTLGFLSFLLLLFFDLDDVRNLSVRTFWKFIKWKGHP